MSSSHYHYYHDNNHIFIILLSEQCNTVLSTLGRNEQCDAAAALFQDMTVNGPLPDKVTNQTMVFVFERVYRYKEAGIFRSILNMAPAIVRTRTGKGQIVQSSTIEKTKATSTSTSNIENKVNNDDDKIPAAQISTFNGKDRIIPDSSTASTVNINNLDEHTYVQNDPTPLEDYYPDSIRLSPAGTLKDKLLADGRRVGKNKKEEFPLKGIETIVSTARTDSESSTKNDVSEKIKKVKNKKGSGEEGIGEIENTKTKVKLTENRKEKEIVMSKDTEKGKGKEKGKIKTNKQDVAVIEREVIKEEKMEEKMEEIKWEKGGGGAAAVIRLLGIAGKSAEAEEIFLSLEKEGEKGGVSLPTALYNAASKCSLTLYHECHTIFLYKNSYLHFIIFSLIVYISFFYKNF